MFELLYDIRQSARLISKSPGLAVSAVFMLALGIGSATAIFSVVNSVLLKPLPYPDSGRIVSLRELNSKGREMRVSLPNYRDWAESATSFEAIAATAGAPATVVSEDRAQRVHAVSFHGDFLPVYGGRIAFGRDFTDDERRTGSPPVALASYGFAQSQFGEAEAAIDKALAVGGLRFTVIGVLPRDFPSRSDVFIPAGAWGPDTTTRTAHNWDVVARLQPDVTLTAARAEMAAIGERLRVEYAGENDAAGVSVRTLLDSQTSGARLPLLLLFAGAGLLVVIACANVANLLLANGLRRTREIAVRQALGAGRARIARQLAAESVFLALLGGAAGALLAQWSFDLLLNLVPRNLPRFDEIGLDLPALGFALAAAVIAGLIAGLAPALRLSRTPVAAALKAESRTASGGDSKIRGVLVVAEFAVAMVLLICAGLLAKSFLRLLRLDPGFGAERVLLAEVEVPQSAYPGEPDLAAFGQALLAAAESIPGIEAAGLTSAAPLEGSHPDGTFRIAGREENGRANYAVASERYFETMGVPLLAGRAFTEMDTAGAPHVALVNESAASQFWSGESPLGRRIRWTGMDLHDNTELTIVGIVANFRQSSLTIPPEPEVYVPFRQRPFKARDLDVVIRTRTEPRAAIAALRQRYREIDRTLPVRFQTMKGVVEGNFARPRFQTLLTGFFALAALVLSAAGLFSTIAFHAGQRTREIGIRLALGGTPGMIHRHFVSQGLVLAAAGVAIGLPLAWGAARLLRGLLFELSGSDPSVFSMVTAILVLVALAAAYFPARRATKIDPVSALREN